MYQKHATEIQRECSASPEAFRDVLCFVLATIQEPIERLPAHMESIRNEGAQSQVLWGMKRKGYADVQRNYRKLWTHLMCAAVTQAPLWRERCIIDIVDTIHGINVAKAGFVMQLSVGAVGCLDSHNLSRFGLNKAAFTISPAVKKVQTKLKKAHAYVTACDTLGGCEFLWNSWCDYVAEQRPEMFDGNGVSEIHLCAVNPF
jgi:hypothetical protein